MKKKILTLIAIFMSVAVLAAVSGIVIYSDPCNKCVITKTDRKCGKCSGFMESTYDKKLSETKKDGNAYYTYKCKKCGHECYGRLKL